MRVNFQIIENYALTFNGRHIDLHNNFDFNSLEYKVEKQSLILRWLKSSGNWVHENELAQLVLIHKQVSFLSVQSRDPEIPGIEDSCLSEITFFPSSERVFNDSILNQSLPNLGDDILYFFQSGQTIRVNCEEIELIIE